MKLEDYFDFHAPNDIRLKGTRVGIERILYDYIHRGWSPEKIEETYRRALTLEQVYATITYYLHNKEDISRYLTEWIEFGDRMRAEQAKNPDATTLRLRKIRKKYGTARNYLEAKRRGLT
jgi:uncharacterized protein (DUF433 family)